MLLTQYPQFQNDGVVLTDAFLAGDHFTLKLAERVFATFDTVGDLADEEFKSYATQYQQAKKLLRQSAPTRVGKDIYHVPQSQGAQVHYLTKVAMVRYINLCHKGKYIIVMGNEVLFQPAHLAHVSKNNLELFINLNLSEDRKKTTNHFLNRVRSWIHGFKFVALSTI